MARSADSQSRVDRNTYVPPNVQQAMTQHMQQNLPQHLKKYVGQNAAYAPQHVQTQLNQAMTKNMPAHMKQYAGAYMQQQVVQPNVNRLRATPQATAVAPHAPTPDKLRRDHGMFGEQHDVNPSGMTDGHQNLFQPDSQSTAPAAQTSPPPAPPPAPLTGPHHPDYEFIMNPGQAPKQPFLGGKSLPIRIAILGGGLVLLLIVFSMLKGVVGGKSNLPSYITVAQDQQSIISLATQAQQQQDLSGSNKNFAITAQLSLSSSQSDMVDYLAKNGKKVSAKSLNMKVSAKTNDQLTAAEQANTYNETFQEVMSDKLNTYMRDLKQTYNESKGTAGKALLNEDYNQAQLLVTQLKSATVAQN